MSQKKNKKAEEKLEAKGKLNFTKRQRSWLYTGAFILVVLAFFIVNNTNGKPEQGPYPPNYISKSQGEKPDAPEFVLPTIGGKELKLSTYKGKIVILDFWATWCPPCRKGIPDLIELKKEYGEKGLEVIGVSVDGITKDGSTVNDIKPFIKEYKINYPIVLGDQQIIYKYGGIQGIPTTFVIDKNGKIAARYGQLVPKQTYVKEIEKILSNE